MGELPFHFPSSSYNDTTGEGSIAVEFATPSINSANFDENVGLTAAAFLQLQINQPVRPNSLLDLGNPNPHLKYADFIQHGYFILDVKPDSVQANWYYVPILEVSSLQNFGNAFYTKDTMNRLRQTIVESAPKEIQDIPAPLTPPGLGTSARTVANFVVTAVFPNPSIAENTINIVLNEHDKIKTNLIDLKGNLVYKVNEVDLPPGIYSITNPVSDLASGIYFYEIRSSKGVKSIPFIRK